MFMRVVVKAAPTVRTTVSWLGRDIILRYLYNDVQICKASMTETINAYYAKPTYTKAAMQYVLSSAKDNKKVTRNACTRYPRVSINTHTGNTLASGVNTTCGVGATHTYYSLLDNGNVDYRWLSPNGIVMADTPVTDFQFYKKVVKQQVCPCDMTFTSTDGSFPEATFSNAKDWYNFHVVESRVQATGDWSYRKHYRRRLVSKEVGDESSIILEDEVAPGNIPNSNGDAMFVMVSSGQEMIDTILTTNTFVANPLFPDGTNRDYTQFFREQNNIRSSFVIDYGEGRTSIGNCCRPGLNRWEEEGYNSFMLDLETDNITIRNVGTVWKPWPYNLEEDITMVNYKAQFLSDNNGV